MFLIILAPLKLVIQNSFCVFYSIIRTEFNAHAFSTPLISLKENYQFSYLNRNRMNIPYIIIHLSDVCDIHCNVVNPRAQIHLC